MVWRKVDLHLHTPGSDDFDESGAGYLDILLKAEERGLDIIAFTDHNTVRGYAAMMAEVQQLEFLERSGRLRPDEKRRLDEFRRLRQKILVLPGFEFTATLGFHILGIFPETTSVRELEHILLRLNVPPDKLDVGSTEIGATTDVLSAYRILDEVGGLVIASHANSSHGVALQGFDFGGQTKIAYTQDPHLHALEVTDLETERRRSTASFYSGSKPEYPRRMHCIQGSDSHRIRRDPKDRSELGVGDRVTEVLLPQVSFAALKALFLGDDFARTRPYRPTTQPFDHVSAARVQGANIVQSFHEGWTRRGGRMHAIICDVVAFANTNGGTIYVGASVNPKVDPVGVEKPEETISAIKAELHRKVAPPLDVEIDTLESQGKKIVRVVVPRGPSVPYSVDGTTIYVRQESETSVAVRDEIVRLVQQATQPPAPKPAPAPRVEPAIAEVKAPPAPVQPVEAEMLQPAAPEAQFRIPPPRTGVEIIATVERKGTPYHTLKDLRNGSVVNNVTRASARRLWRYAITQHEEAPVAGETINWSDDIGFWKAYTSGGKQRYNLVQKDSENRVHVYYGVSDEGFHGEWRQFLQGE
jgi:hypothetical protein